MTAHPKGKRVLVKHMLTAGISLMVLFCVALVPLFAASNATNTFDGVREIGQTIPGGTVSQAVGSTPIIIDQPGSYRLISNVVARAGNAIELRSSNVTLDLNGFNVAAAGMGILSMGLSQLQRIVVINRDHRRTSRRCDLAGSYRLPCGARLRYFRTRWERDHWGLQLYCEK